MMPYTPVRHFFTVDVEDYFQVGAFEPYVTRASWDSRPSRVERNVDVLLGLLANANARGTFFTLGWIAQRYPRMIREIVRQGHEIASHGATHTCVNRLTPTQFREEVRTSKRVLEDISGAHVIGFRAPNFSLLPGYEWAFDVLLEESYEYDSSRFPIDRPNYGCPNAPRYPHAVRCESVGGSLMEIPLTTLDLFGSRLPAAGGASLRHFPYAVIRNAFRAAQREGVPGVFYVHPWEVDPDQPRIRVPFTTRVRHYGGLARTAPRVTRLLREFQFQSIAEGLPELSQNAPALYA
jgi:polysaccharide deacetylase family protein (PEP-CTERM system associated)